MIPAGLAVHAQGQGAQQALLVHCALADSSAWKGVTRRLAPHLSMRLADLPGHGGSADWDGSGDLARAVMSQLAALCDGPVDMIGHSVGAVLLLRLALEHPNLCRSLTLIEPVVFTATDTAPAVLAYLAQVAAMKAVLARGDRDGAAERFNGIWGAVGWSRLPEATRAAQRDRVHYVRAFEAALERDSGGLLAPGRLEALAAPVLLVEGSESPAVVGHVAAGLAARLPAARQRTIPGAGHMAPITHPRPVAGAILEFLSPR